MSALDKCEVGKDLDQNQPLNKKEKYFHHQKNKTEMGEAEAKQEISRKK